MHTTSASKVRCWLIFSLLLLKSLDFTHTFLSFLSFIQFSSFYLFPLSPSFFSVFSFTFFPPFPNLFFYLDFLLSFLPSTSHLAFFIKLSFFLSYFFLSLSILFYLPFSSFSLLLPFHGRTSYLFVYFIFIYTNMISYDNTNWLWSLNKALTLSSSKPFFR